MFGLFVFDIVLSIVALILSGAYHNPFDRKQVGKTIVSYLAAFMVVLFIGSIFMFDDLLYYRLTCFYPVFAGIFIYTPFFIKKYVRTPHYKNKELDYLLAFLLFVLSGIMGMFCYLNSIRVIGIVVPSYWFYIGIFLPLLPIIICLYIGDKS